MTSAADRRARVVDRLDDTEQWEQQLSSDEQHRLTFARGLLQRPDWLFFDDATAGLDGPMEQRVFDVLARRLPDATIVAMTNKPELARYLRRTWEIVAEGTGSAVLRTG